MPSKKEHVREWAASGGGLVMGGALIMKVNPPNLHSNYGDIAIETHRLVSTVSVRRGGLRVPVGVSY